MIVDYFVALKGIVFSFSHIISDFSSTEKIYSENKGFIGGEIVFIDDSRLDFAEVKDTEQLVILKYRYHYIG